MKDAAMWLRRSLVFLIVALSINVYATTEHVAAQLAHDAYFSESDFRAKYEKSTQSIESYTAISVKYYSLLTPNNDVMIVFQGSKELKHWESNFKIGESKFLNVADTKVHQGFYEEALAARKKLNPHLDTEQKIIVTGHSLGAAVALLFSAMLHHDGYKVELYTFGSPPVGNQKFIDSIKELKHTRYTHIFDIIPKMKKEYVDQVKSSMSQLNDSINENETIRQILSAIDNTSYDYIHHGQHIFLFNTEALSDKYNNSNFGQKLIARTLLYHSSKTYLDGVE